MLSCNNLSAALNMSCSSVCQVHWLGHQLYGFFWYNLCCSVVRINLCSSFFFFTMPIFGLVKAVTMLHEICIIH